MEGHNRQCSEGGMVHRRCIKIAIAVLKYIDSSEKYNILESVMLA